LVSKIVLKNYAYNVHFEFVLLTLICALFFGEVPLTITDYLYDSLSSPLAFT
jgi:hypothetical protein